jgi:hypothetical protein
MMTLRFYEKTPSLSLRLRVGTGTQERKQTSNKLECRSSLFESIRGSRLSVRLRGSSTLEFSRTSLNNLEQITEAAHG